MNGFAVPIRITETHGLERQAEVVRFGVPLGRGLVEHETGLCVTNGTGQRLPGQTRVLARWPDRSIKWLLVDTLVAVPARSETTLLVRPAEAPETAVPGSPAIHLTQTAVAITIDTGAARFHVPATGQHLLSSVTCGDRSTLSAAGLSGVLRNVRGDRLITQTDEVRIEEHGSLVATLMLSGRFAGAAPAPLRFTARMKFVAGSAGLELAFSVWNPEPALHPGGLWDLGDPASYHFKDLTLRCEPAEPARSLRWYAAEPFTTEEASVEAWSLYQDSSGGEQWRSPNHIDRLGRPTVRFRGFQVTGAAGGSEVARAGGDRATPGVAIQGDGFGIAATIGDFWQTFPKALRSRHGGMELALFPEECAAGFELQGGERKRHHAYVDFAPVPDLVRLAAWQNPLIASVDPRWIEQTGAILWFTAASDLDDPRYTAYINQIVEGPSSFFARREIIDEYGWRNFGDLYADHEAVHHRGPDPFVSHYNNQYDFIYGSFLHWQRTGDERWRRLMDDAARHVIDIDIYRTQGDKSAYNGGLFWHTDHYKPAATATHRTHSRANAGGGDYGGGPADEHNYSSGLLHYYLLTGDPDAAEAVRILADWVCAMDDGALSLFGVIDEGPTGAASASRDHDYHKPGRGGGNSINTLMDAYAVGGDWRYWLKAEELIRRCVHPADDIAALQLDDPERRWSYLVFFQVLGKYLEIKRERHEIDYMFRYACDSLLHYARWMQAHEVPFKDVLHKVELPTETWPAHDVRKCHIFHLAAQYSSAVGPGTDAAAFRERADFFYRRCLDDLLGFTTASLTRPLVILCVYGAVQAYFQSPRPAQPSIQATHAYEFGVPHVFTPQRRRLGATLRRKARLVRGEVTRMIRQKLHGWRAR